MSVFFECQGAKLHYGNSAAPLTVLEDISLSIRQGERVALLGKSGSGKSTLLGHMREQLISQCAWCPQQPALVQQLSLFHNIYTGGLTRHSHLANLRNLFFPSAAVQQEIGAIAEQLQLQQQLWKKAGELSGGQQQRVGIGRALYQRRRALLADEPVSALDAEQGRLLLTSFLAQHDTSVIALHHVELALSLCDRVIGLADGKIVIDAASKSLQLHDLTQLYQ
ncbi:phosphonate ABC transporter ATP-binding protein [Simiduia litorea]|uniref:ATP-binding cassette domain-containing protein n=1 Tax=Simiduia litorea TaxID=1435348 RepID=UPI0036F300DA